MEQKPDISNGSEQSATTTSTGGSPKLVPESDLMAIKAQLEKLSASTKDLQSAIAERDAIINQLRTELENAKASSSSTEDLSKRLAELEAELAASKESRNKLESQLVDTKISTLSQRYGVPVETLRGKSLDQLALIESVLSKSRLPSNSFDAIGSGQTANLSAREKIKQGLAMANKLG
jgi:predicted RNase H-like nuclease (RuvC/YqgF family)